MGIKQTNNDKDKRTTGKFVQVFLEVGAGRLWPCSNCHGFAVKV